MVVDGVAAVAKLSEIALKAAKLGDVAETVANLGNAAARTIEGGATVAKLGEVAVKKIAEIKGTPLLETKESSQILKPNLETIKTQSLESIVQSNIEKVTETNASKITEVPSAELQPLSGKLSETLKAEGILSDNAIGALRVDNEGNLVLKCINEKLADQIHEITGVPYIEKSIDVGSARIKVVVPEFPTAYVTEIPKELWKAGDREIFKYCTEQLKEKMQLTPELTKQFTPQQLEQMMSGEPYIKGLTWNHSEIPDRMELVETGIHAMSSHTGGNTIWCGGIR